MNKTISVLCVATAFAFTSLAQAHEDPETGRVSLQAQTSMEIDNDTMRVVLFVEDEDANPARLADSVNKLVADAVKIARTETKVKMKTGRYQTFPVYDKTRIVRWRARSELQLESTEFKSLSDLIGRLQSTMKLGGVDFSVSPEVRKQIEDDLTASAIAEFKRKADLVAQGFGARGYKVKEASVNSDGGAPPMPRPMMAYAKSAVTADAVQAPTVEAGTSRINVSVNGTILLEGL